MHKQQLLRSIATLTALASLAAAQTPAGPAEILYINTPGHPTNVVPGTGGLAFNAGGGSTAAVIRPWFSQDESQFLIEVFAETGTVTTNDNCYLLNGNLLMREGDPTPWNPLELWGVLDDDVGLSNSGDVLITQNTSLTTNDDIVARFTAGVWTELAREGGLVDPFVPTLAGALWDDSMDTPRLGAGQALWRSDLVDFVPAITIGDEFLLQPSGVPLREGFDIPVGQAGGATAAWENFTLGETYVNESGSLMLVLGDTDAATTDDQILAINNIVVLQENQIIPGSSFANPIDLSGIVQAWLDNADNWWARGNNDITEDDWVVRNGVVLLTSDGTSEVVPGSGEFFDDARFTDCFFAMDGSLSGAWVVGGVTNNIDPQRDGVIVYDDGFGGRQVIAREGDPIDVDGNGFFDDDRFFNTFGNDDVILLESGYVVFTATVENGLGTAVDQGLFRVKIGGATCVRRNGTGINFAGCECLTLPVMGTNLVIGFTPDPATVLTFVAISGAPFAPTPLFGGELLIDPFALDTYTAVGNHTFSLPPAPTLFGQTAYMQGARLDSTAGGTIVLLNALDVKIGL